jgi:2-haloacid dehalogenase
MTAIKAIAFDMYGTLYDVNSVAARCNALFPGRGEEMSRIWRQKSLEYTWLRSLMEDYRPFEAVTEDALVFTCAQLGLSLDAAARSALCEAYLHLEPHPEVPAALAELEATGTTLTILSNGSAHSIGSVVRNSGLEKHFAALLSADSVKVYKPHHAVYEIAEQQLGLERTEILFVSSNPWDASGASHFGFPVCWVNRGGKTFDELGQAPDHVVTGIDALPAYLEARNGH